MRRVIWFIALSVVCSLAVSCTTMNEQEMSYFGDVTSKEVVVGSSFHLDFMGIGVTPRSYADEYTGAVAEAYRNSPEGTTVLRNLKGFKSKSSWPQALGVIFIGAGSYSLSQGENSKTPVPYLIGAVGATLWLINVYDYIVMAEPSN